LDPVYLVSFQDGRWHVTNDGSRIASCSTLDDAILSARLMAVQRSAATGKPREVLVHNEDTFEVVFRTD